MRAWWASVICAALVGCLGRGDRTPVESVARSLAPVVPAEGIHIKSVLLERPVADAFLDRDLWDAVQPIRPQETRALLAENGIRAGVLSGTPPQKFLTMLESEAETLNGRELTFALRKDEVLPTSGPHEKCAFDLLADLAGKRTPITLKKARCGVMVRPEAVGHASVKVSCEPQIQHGERQEWFRPTADGLGLMKYDEIPLARFQPLAFDVPLGPGDYLLIGWHAEQPNTVGEALFAVSAGGVPRQRVLVIRAWHANPGPAPDLPSLGPTRRTSVAAEAARPTR